MEQSNFKKPPKRLISDIELRARLRDISSTTLWRLRQKGIVPMPAKLGHLNGTPEDEAEEIIARLTAQRIGGKV